MNNKQRVDCAIFAAMPEELEPIESIFSACKLEAITINGFIFNIYHYRNCRILTAKTGIGATSAATVVSLIHAYCHPSYILMTGTAGGIGGYIRLRDVVIAESAFEAEIQGVFSNVMNTPFESCLINPLKNEHCPSIFSAHQELLSYANMLNLSDINIHTGTVVSSNMFPAPQQLFDDIKDKKPYSIDMETAALYQAAWILNIPALAIRGISNILNDDGTDDNIPQSDVTGSTKAAAQVTLNILDKLIDANVDRLQKHITTSVNSEVNDIISTLQLNPHPEGGYYTRTFKSEHSVKSLDGNRYNNEARSAGSAIYYLLDGDNFSAWHCIHSDEIWHYYKGSAVNIHMIDAAGNFSTHLLGDPKTCAGAAFQVIIPAGVWFAAENADKSSYCLAGCTVSPGFEFTDFNLADKDRLIHLFPQHETIITQFTR